MDYSHHCFLTHSHCYRKTELALQLLKDMTEYDFVLWICATTQETLGNDVKHCALRLQDEFRRISSGSSDGHDSSNAHQVYFPDYLRDVDGDALSLWLHSTATRISKVLLVVDDLDGVDINARKDLRRGLVTSNIDTIFTTRNPNIGSSGGDFNSRPVCVPPLDKTAGLNLLSNLMLEDRHTEYNIREMSLKATKDSMYQIVNLVDGNPAAILVASSLAKTEYMSESLSKSLRDLLEHWPTERILDHREDDMTYPYTIRKSLQVSEQRLRRDCADQKRFASCMMLLQALSLLGLKSFTEKDLENLHKQFEKPSRDTDPRTSRVLDTIDSPKRSASDLLKASLLSRAENGRIILSELTKLLALQDDMDEPERSLEIKK